MAPEIYNLVRQSKWGLSVELGESGYAYIIYSFLIQAYLLARNEVFEILHHRAASWG